MPDRKSIWDPLRMKVVTLTPEEVGSQWCIGVLAESLRVPMTLMMSEAGFRYGGKQFRADILVYDRSVRPLMIVECKRPQVELTNEVLDQTIRYNMALDVKYILITNGKKTYICQKRDGKLVFLQNFPTYEEMICQQ